MDFKKIEKSLDNVQKIKRQLDKINDREALIELRVFTRNQWINIDFQPKNKAIYNMVVHQIVMELQAELKKEEINIKKATQ